MAYVGNAYSDKVKFPTTSTSNMGNDTRVTNPNIPTSGGGGTIGGGGAGGPATQAGGSQPGSYTNLLSYLGANTESGAATGRGAANVVNQDYNKAMADQGAYSKSANAALDTAGNAVQQDQGVMDRINAGAPGVDQSYLGKINTGAVTSFDPYTYSGPALSDIQVSYQGPNSVSNLTGQAGTDRARSLQSNERVADSAGVKGAGSFEGTQNLLGRAFANPNYTHGERGLDAFLSRGTAGGRDALNSVTGLGERAQESATALDQGLGDKIAGYQRQAGNTNANYARAIDAAKAKTTATNNKYLDALANPNGLAYGQDGKAVTGGQIFNPYTSPGTLVIGKDYDNNTPLPVGYDKPHITGVQSNGSEYNGYGMPNSYTSTSQGAPNPPLLDAINGLGSQTVGQANDKVLAPVGGAATGVLGATAKGLDDTANYVGGGFNKIKNATVGRW